MADLTITGVSGSTPMRDGQYVSVTVELDNGDSRRLRFATDQLDWLANGLFQTAMAGFSEQAQAGARPATTGAVEVHSAQALRSAVGVEIQIAGAEQSTRRGAISSYALTSEAAKELAYQLLIAAGD